jgi:hypothetical protein
METIEERTHLMDAIAAAGDAAVLRFAAECMRLIEANGEITAEDAQRFASKAGLL